MKKILAVCFFSIPLLVFTQEYKSAFGVKVGYPGYVGLNGKFFMGKWIALDNTAGVNFDRDNRFAAFSPIVEFNKKFGTNDGYNWYAGVGPNVQYYLNGGYIHDDMTKTSGLFLKTDALFGVEYTAPGTRFNAAIEGGPSVNVYPFIKVGGFVNVAVRYAFVNRFDR
ncbi:MAG: hypothetical protein K0R65_1439 [Crocinitomicaceae bacterium]|jgi:hypothetical protein|nr:hypothetical protein [Crocinitomicaceae bacterium]